MHRRLLDSHFKELRFRVYVRQPATRQIVDDPHAIAPLQVSIDDVAADESGTPGDENPSTGIAHL